MCNVLYELNEYIEEINQLYYKLLPMLREEGFKTTMTESYAFLVFWSGDDVGISVSTNPHKRYKKYGYKYETLLYGSDVTTNLMQALDYDHAQLFTSPDEIMAELWRIRKEVSPHTFKRQKIK